MRPSPNLVRRAAQKFQDAQDFGLLENPSTLRNCCGWGKDASSMRERLKIIIESAAFQAVVLIAIIVNA
ncbi:MAG: hypothetical protein AAFY22_08680, partial [Pseudomonadota bacterium]